MTPISILDLVRVTEQGRPRVILNNACDFAVHAERLGFLRFWVAEHRNMPSIASAARALVIAHIAGGTKSIRVGAGGFMRVVTRLLFLMQKRSGTRTESLCYLSRTAMLGWANQSGIDKT